MAKKGGDIWERSYGIAPKSAPKPESAASRAVAAIDGMPDARRRRAYVALCAAVLAAFLAFVGAGACMADRAQTEPSQQQPSQPAAGEASDGPSGQGGGSGEAADPRLRFSGLSSLSFMDSTQVEAACVKARAHFEAAGFAADEVLRVFAIPGDESVFWVSAPSEPVWAEATPGADGWDEISLAACEKPARLSEYLDSR